MFLYKIFLHVNATVKKTFFKVIYTNRIHFGKNVTFRKRFNIFIDNKGKIDIGDNCFFNNDCSLNAQQEIKIGHDTIFGENVKIYDHNHVFKEKDRKIKNQGFKTAKVSIGNNCWIASNVIILKGVTIGDNVVIGAGCIIKNDISNNQIVRKKEKLEIEERL